MITCTRRLEWDMGHRVPKHAGKCRSPHGHRYAAEITCAPTNRRMTEEGFVVDFGLVKQKVGGWIDATMDHAFAVQYGDPFLGCLEALGLTEEQPKTFLMRDPPTAEHLATLVLREAKRLLEPHGVQAGVVRIYETPNCWADATWWGTLADMPE